MRNKKREVNVEVLVGLFLSVALLALGVFTIVLGGNSLLKEHYSVEVFFDEIGGLQEGEGVYLRGKQIGYVKTTELLPREVRVVLELDHPVTFRENYRVEVMSASMLGGKFLQLYLGDPAGEPLEPDTHLIGEQPVDVMENLNLAVSSLQQIMMTFGSGEGTLGKLMTDETLYNQLLELNTGLLGFMKQLQTQDGSFARLMRDPDLYIEAEALISRLNRLAEGVEEGEGLIGQLMTEETRAIEQLEFTMAQLGMMMGQLNSTNGTLGKLINDPQLYDEGTELMEEARATMDDLRETSPLRSFGSVLFGAF